MALTLRSSSSFINSNYIKNQKTSNDFPTSVSFPQLKPIYCLQAKNLIPRVQILCEKTLFSDERIEEKEERLHGLSGKLKTGSRVPVFIMFPLDTVSLGGNLNRPRSLNASLMALKSAGVEGVMVDAWWGLVEKDGPLNYNWDGYAELVQMVQKHGLKLQVVMSFHQCGGNVGDSCRFFTVVYRQHESHFTI